MPDFWRTTRFRVAVMAFAASGASLGAMSGWFVLHAQSRLENVAARFAAADADADAIVQLLNNGTRPADLRLLVRDSIYEIKDRSGTSVASCPALREGTLSAYDTEVTLRSYQIDRTSQASVGCTSELAGAEDDLTLHVVHADSGTGGYAVYAGVQLDPEARAAVDSLRTVLAPGVPGVALLIGVLAWLAVRRSLHPVEAIRCEIAEIGAHNLSRPRPRTAYRGRDRASRRDDEHHAHAARRGRHAAEPIHLRRVA
ncbi:HAMP domain-containing protein [Amycolatopsis benzoatilytica]|uniref:HAMP domain-containing protein n=1 Tax=Amycolatopsis benzoatilytica TaxID=346045 RepID=UPI00039B9DCD|nr:HAMP domain-containing protein [Amycolatopsis benzoatilytica]